MNILITGANGFIGTALVEYFARRGHTLTAFVHLMPAAQYRGVLYRTYDLSQPVAEAELSGRDVVIHCAYIKSEDHSHADEINFNGTRALYDAAKKAGVRKFIYLSSLSAHDQALSNYGRMKYKIESALDPATDLILKPGLVIGRGGLFKDIAGYFQRSTLIPLVDAGKNRVQCVALDDLAKSIEVGITRDIAGTFAIAAQEPITLRAMYRSISRKMNRKIVPIPVPFRLVNLGFLLLHALHIKTQVTRESLLGLKQNRLWNVTEAARAFGIRYKSCQQAIEEMD